MMKRGDVSFTFIHRIQEIEWNIRDERWQSALALALTIPDICGGIAYPQMVKRYRDGRVMEDRNGLPVRDVGSQYILWFDTFAATYFKRNPSDKQPYLSGERCWQLRCEYLHQNKGFYNNENEEKLHFHLGIHCGTSVCTSEEQAFPQEGIHIRLDIQQICDRMCQAAKAYYENNHAKENFSLYHTPVLDFVQWANRGEDLKKTVAILCKDRTYAAGIQETLRGISSLIEIFTYPEEAKTFFKKKKPALWIITEDMLGQKHQPWKADMVPVLLLSETQPVTDTKKYIWISAPFLIEQLRGTVRKQLK